MIAAADLAAANASAESRVRTGSSLERTACVRDRRVARRGSRRQTALDDAGERWLDGRVEQPDCSALQARVVSGKRLLDSMNSPSNRYLVDDQRDFFYVTTR